MPVIDFTNIYDAITRVKTLEKPLLCLIYSRDNKRTAHVLTSISFGSGGVTTIVSYKYQIIISLLVVSNIVVWVDIMENMVLSAFRVIKPFYINPHGLNPISNIYHLSLSF